MGLRPPSVERPPFRKTHYAHLMKLRVYRDDYRQLSRRLAESKRSSSRGQPETHQTVVDEAPGRVRVGRIVGGGGRSQRRRADTSRGAPAVVAGHPSPPGETRSTLAQSGVASAYPDSE